MKTDFYTERVESPGIENINDAISLAQSRLRERIRLATNKRPKLTLLSVGFNNMNLTRNITHNFVTIVCQVEFPSDDGIYTC